MKAIALLALALVLAGCGTPRHPADEAMINQIKPGESTRADVERILGPPRAVQKYPEAKGFVEVLTYTLDSTEVRNFRLTLMGQRRAPEKIQRVILINIGADGKVTSIDRGTMRDTERQVNGPVKQTWGYSSAKRGDYNSGKGNR